METPERLSRACLCSTSPLTASSATISDELTAQTTPSTTTGAENTAFRVRTAHTCAPVAASIATTCWSRKPA